MAEGGGFDLQSLLQPFRAQEVIGKVLSGCKVEKLLGKGAMGEAYLARREADGAPVVVKRIEPSLAADPALKARLQREWQALARIRRHPSVVGIHGVALDADPPHMVLEYVPGVGLDALLERRGQLPALEAARITRDLARGLAAVHEQGLLHRDVKPANAILRPDGTATLVDFGLAKDVFMTSMTQAGTLMGTAAYMAPELWGDQKVADPAVDLFALGATLFHLLAGRAPFDGADVQEIADQVTGGDYPAVAEVAPDAPPELGLVVDLCLEVQPRFRYARADDLADDLDRLLAGGACRAPCLIDAAGRRWPLVRARRWTIGGEASCQVVLAGASPRHAQLRREADAFVLVDIQGSAGTSVGGQRLTGPRPLRDGDRLALGAVELTFHEPLRRAAAGATVGFGPTADVRRVAAPDPLVRALAARGDPRVAAWLVERLAPDPDDDARTEARLAPLVGPEAARAAVERRRADDGRLAAWAVGPLAAISGERPDPAHAPIAQWLAWWARARGAFPLQLAPASPARPALRLRAIEPGGGLQELALGAAPADPGVVLVGKDPRCHVRLAGASAPRLLATIVRLHRRFAVRDERAAREGGAGAPGAVRLLEPNATTEVGGVALRLEQAPDAPLAAGGPIALEPDAFWALEALGHPAVAAALIQLLDEARRGWPWLEPALAASLGSAGIPAEEAARLAVEARTQLGARAQAVRPRLAALLGHDAGDDPAAWRALLARRPAAPALAPAGWLEATARG